MLKRLTEWATAIFHGHDRNLLRAASVVREFPETILFDPNATGSTLVVGSTPNGFAFDSMDAGMWLAYSGKFRDLGLVYFFHTDERLTAYCRGRIGMHAIAHAFGLKPWWTEHLFNGSNPDRIADRIESFARDHV